MNPARPLLLLLLGLTAALTGCASSGGKKEGASAPIALEPTLVSQSYDYTSPQNIANQDQPVWVLPVKNTGWEKGGISQDGSWHSGQYRSYIVKPGYWSSQEEAQLSGRPYLVNNQTVIPSPAPEGGPSTNPGAQELDISQTNSRLDALEQKSGQSQATTGNPDDQAATAAREQALATLASPQVKTDIETTSNSDDDSSAPQLSVPKSARHKVKTTTTTSTTDFNTPPVAGAKQAHIHFFTPTTGTVIVDGKGYPFTIKHPGDPVSIQIPENQQ